MKRNFLQNPAVRFRCTAHAPIRFLSHQHRNESAMAGYQPTPPIDENPGSRISLGR